MNLAGVREASVSYDRGSAEIVYDSRIVKPEQLEKAIHDAGYQPQEIHVAHTGNDQ